MGIIKRVICMLAVASLIVGCASRGGLSRTEYITLEATGYCKCQECCGWKRNLLMQSVYAYGDMKGEKKKIGQTASGTKAKPGHTIAADTTIFPFGTRMKVPGYGWGTVEERGGAIKGNKIDLFFKTHKQALEWGRQTVKVEVVMP